MTVATHMFLKLKQATLAIDKHTGKPTLITIPAGAIIQIAVDELQHIGMTEVEWQGLPVDMFMIDLKERGMRVYYKGNQRDRMVA